MILLAERISKQKVIFERSQRVQYVAVLGRDIGRVWDRHSGWSHRRADRRRLGYLVQADFTPYEAIEAGTRNAAEALGRLDEFGTVTEGQRADLILVEENPLEDVANVGKQAGVVLRGSWLAEDRLRGMLDG